jgi:hypothetical protein
MEIGAKKTILCIELWHGLMLMTLLSVLGPRQIIEPLSLLLGGAFTASNFFLLSVGVAWVIRPMAVRGQVKWGIALLVFKVLLFLGFLLVLFFRFNIDAISFSLGFSTLFLAILLEAVRMSTTLGS